MNPNNMLVGNITVAEVNALREGIVRSNGLIASLLNVISIYAEKENYANGLNHTLAFDFLSKLETENIITKKQEQANEVML